MAFFFWFAPPRGSTGFTALTFLTPRVCLALRGVRCWMNGLFPCKWLVAGLALGAVVLDQPKANASGRPQGGGASPMSRSPTRQAAGVSTAVGNPGQWLRVVCRGK